ncbi:MAG: phosphomannomutase/phosphoglucomutase [Anaerolineae bacterium]|nr:phosphomannomutase/phosphoglucomutase [Anaerolineae bacterium]
MGAPETINPAIFRGSDIRGKVGKDLTDKTAEQIGKAYGTYVRQKGGQKVYVGYDNRPSSNKLADGFADGLVTTGCRVIELGFVPTPLLYFVSVKDNGSFGAMITGSHLPVTSNGFKFCQGSRTLHGENIRQLYDIALEEEFISGDGSRSPSKSAVSEYVEYILQLKIHKSGMKVVVDCQNGAASELAPALFEKLGALVHRLHCDPTAPYPFERPDPQYSANLAPLQKLVKEVNADVGIAYDGDADRLGVVDDRGNHIPADRIVAIFARDVLARNPGAKVVFDILSSQVLADEISKNGGTPIVWKSGHSFIKDKLHEEGALLAGESSGHIFFADRYFGYDDAIYASCRLLELLSRSDKSLSQFMETVPRIFTSPEERPYCPDDRKFQIVKDIETVFRQDGYQLTTVDGVRIQFPKGWGLVRASNTEAVLSLRFEAMTADELKSYREIVWEKLAEIGQQYNVDFTGV